MMVPKQHKLLLILVTFIAAVVKKSVSNRTFSIVNECEETVWPAMISTTSGSVNLGFVLKPGETSVFTTPENFTGTLWGRTGCDFNRNGTGKCETGGSCGGSLDKCSSSEPPATLAKFGLAKFNSLDFYDVSLVDGFNLPLAIIPVNDKQGCNVIGCNTDLRLNCSSELALKTSQGKIIGCLNACQVFQTDQYCCKGDYGTPETCKPTSYSKQFKDACPTAYSYALDDASSTFTCRGADFLVKFCSSSRLSQKPISACDRCVNSGGRCTYNQTTVQCSVGASSMPTVNVTGGKPSHNDTHPFTSYRAGGLPLRKKITIGVFIGVGVVAGLILLSYLFIYRKNQRKSKKRITTSTPNVEQFLENYGFLSLQRYNYKDIKKMTNSFKDNLGQGGYGSVFKGKLIDGRLVAVKVLINDPKKGNGEEFMNEVATIGRTNHINVVTLLGFCSSGSKRALVYEFMPNGSLEKFIHTKKEDSSSATTTEITCATATTNATHQLGWEKLYEIAVGIARGLEYLHRGCNTGRILHFDIKPHNILLDENFCPKISDFGLAKLCPTRESFVSMHGGGRGTLGYIAPEVYCRNFGGVSYKSDVYSYGMMVLEMVGGRKNIDPFVENRSEIYFPHWIYDHLEDGTGKIEELLRFEGDIEEEMARKMIMVGLWCVQTNPDDRPSMGKVGEMLEGRLEDLLMPPKPIVESGRPRPSTAS